MTKPKLHVGADHAGYELKAHLRSALEGEGYDVEDHGTHTPDRVDYPDFAAGVARAVRDEPGSFGILVCGSGIGVSMAANRFKGVRAVVAALAVQAALARNHNDANVLCLGARITAPAYAETIVSTFLDAEFEGGRHQGRVEKIDTVANKP